MSRLIRVGRRASATLSAVVLVAAATITLVATDSISTDRTAAALGETVLISEFRLRGPSGANDEFIELYNPSPNPFTIVSDDGTGGWTLGTSAGVIPFTIPDGTVIPGRGHYLGANSVSYSLGAYPGGAGNTTPNVTWSADIADNTGLALFRTLNVSNFNALTRADSVGPATVSDTLYKEGTGLGTMPTNYNLNLSFARNELSGVPIDTENNATDFLYVDTNGTASNNGQRLGSPGPQNLTSPVTRNAELPMTLLDPSTTDKLTPNLVRDHTSDPATNSTFGRVTLRRTITNNTGGPVTRLRFRVLKLTTFPSPSGTADLRPITSTDTTVTVGGVSRTVRGTTLEQPPSQPNGGGFNSSFSVTAISAGTPLAAGGTVDVQFVFGIQQTGALEADLNVEALPAGGGTAGAPNLFACATTEQPSGTGNCNNPSPVAVNDSYSGPQDTAVIVPAPGLLSNDSDPEGEAITAVKLADPAHGTVTVNANGSFTYTPTTGWYGTDTFTYRAFDGNTYSPAATVTLNISHVNHAPGAVGDTYPVAEDGTLTVPAPGVLANDTDSDGDPLTAVQLGGANHGTVTLNGDGSFVYSPAANYEGPDSFTYRAFDGALQSANATVSITVTGVNDPPTAVADTYTVEQDNPLTVAAPGVLGNDTDVDGDSLTATLSTPPSHGSMSMNPDGSFSYTPAPGYTGPDSFTYVASDGTLNSAPVAATITVTVGAHPPVAQDDAYTTVEDTTLSVPAPGVLANDTDSDGDPLTAALDTVPAHGTVTVNADGSFTYVPHGDFHGTDQFSYTVSDAGLLPAVGHVTITVTPANDAPVAHDDAYSTAEDTTLTVPVPGVLGNDQDVDGDVLTSVEGTGPRHGRLVLHADGSFTYTPGADFHGTDTFGYRATDGAASSRATVRITVRPVTDPVVAPPRSAVVVANTGGEASTINLAALIENPDNLRFTVIDHTDGKHGDVTCGGTTCSYTPDAGFSGEDSFGYAIRTSANQVVRGTVALTVRLSGEATQVTPELPSTGARPFPALLLGLTSLGLGIAVLLLTAVFTRRRGRAPSI